MVFEGRIPLGDAETAAIDQLIATHGNPVGFSRRDPGETGPIVLELADGRRFEVSDNGEVAELG